ncbi:MAG: SET domain-containing protein [Aggregatilineales bacterium]
MKIPSYLSEACEAHDGSPIHRVGVFAKEYIAEGELIATWGGYMMSGEACAQLPLEIRQYGYPVQIGDNLYLAACRRENFSSRSTPFLTQNLIVSVINWS